MLEAVAGEYGRLIEMWEFSKFTKLENACYYELQALQIINNEYKKMKSEILTRCKTYEEQVITLLRFINNG